MKTLDAELTKLFGEPLLLHAEQEVLGCLECKPVLQWGNSEMGLWFTKIAEDSWHFYGHAQGRSAENISAFMGIERTRFVIAEFGPELRSRMKEIAMHDASKNLGTRAFSLFAAMENDLQ